MKRREEIVQLEIIADKFSEARFPENTDHYSLLGFTKAYNSAKKNCS